ncbi:LamG domain-containing protein [Streptomyces sp. NBC_01433]|uniref:LamG domain-containing protein n=1 Tax=Streptomyces sp. NBC_01433 TaxID=2903864 RepID=UPI0022501E20|nr:LamG domain-containing protein [Streptomyces sp. NBC_01433]MCX4676026.1 LamG domain-containing protein [Streptomyces sp. NBC_01433]
MARRWPLITTITVLTVALAFVVVQLVRGQDSEKQQAGKEQPAAKPAASSTADDADPLQDLGWWPLHRSGTAKAGEHDASVRGGTQWTDGPEGGALRLNGTSGYVDSHTRLDPAGKDYSVAARVRLSSQGMTGMRTALSQDGDRISAFFLQYSGQDGNFAFSFSGARTVATTPEKPQPGRWYHLTGTYSQKDHRMQLYVDGRLAGTRVASSNVKPTGTVVIGRGKFDGKAADFWNGDIADVHLYDRELTSREVGSLSSREPG